MKLTKKLIESTPCPASGQVFLRDSEMQNFALRLTPNRKTFIFEKRIHGRNTRITIGPFGVLTVEQARTKALQYAAEVLSGGNPAEKITAQREEATLIDLIALYKEHHLPKKRSIRNDLGMIKNILSKWNNRKLSSITRKEIALLHATVGKTARYQANRVLALLRKMFNLAKIWGLYSGDNPATGIEKFREEKRERFIEEYELPRLFAAIAEEANIRVRRIILVALLTGVRRNEVFSMRWEDINFISKTWKISKTKNGQPHLLPLPAPVISMLSQLSRQSDNPFVFPSIKGEGHVVNIKRAWNRIRQRARLEDVRFHDLRRTCGSWMANQGIPLQVIGKVLNHSQISTTEIYARLILDPQRKALEGNAERMLAIGTAHTTSHGINTAC